MLKELREYCLQLPGVTEDIKWENHLCFNVGGKMFLITSPDSFPVSASFKTNDELFISLPDKNKDIKPAPYLARNKWLHISNINSLPLKEWKKLITISYDLVFSKLPVKLKKEIKENS